MSALRAGDPVEWSDAYGGTQWGEVLRVERSGRVYVLMLSFRGRARAKPTEVFWEPAEAHLLRRREQPPTPSPKGGGE